MPTRLEIFLNDKLNEVANFSIHLYRSRMAADLNRPLNQIGIPFKNFSWVKRCKLARCAQPGYNGLADTVHSITATQLNYLKKHNFSQVISLNHCLMNANSIQTLAVNNITYRHIVVADFQPIGLAQLTTLVGNIESAGQATLVYCGFGEGRTGTLVSAWAVRQILKRERTFFSKFDWIKLGFFVQLGFGVEKPEQMKEVGEYVKSLAPRPVYIKNAPTQNQGVMHPKNIARIGPTPTSNVWDEYLDHLEIANQAAFVGFDNSDMLANGAKKTDQKQMVKFGKFLKQINGPLVIAAPAPLQTLPAAPVNTVNNDENAGQTLWNMGSENGLQAFD